MKVQTKTECFIIIYKIFSTYFHPTVWYFVKEGSTHYTLEKYSPFGADKCRHVYKRKIMQVVQI